MTLISLVVSLVVAPEHLGPSRMLYIGPDQILPLTSWLAGVVGVLLIFWRYVVGLASKLWRTLLRRDR